MAGEGPLCLPGPGRWRFRSANVPRRGDGVLVGPAVELADRDEAAPSAVDDAQVAEDVAFEVVAADAEGGGGLVDGEGDAGRWRGSGALGSALGGRSLVRYRPAGWEGELFAAVQDSCSVSVS